MRDERGKLTVLQSIQADRLTRPKGDGEEPRVHIEIKSAWPGSELSDAPQFGWHQKIATCVIGSPGVV